ncbi:alpha/beta fold hydrolase [Salibacterium salarium]|uniref:Alpha/beta fold hydrolase n=1 Tax=Salibacterium salarium TaxID=284579 RepID=A0A3R9WRM9_9BACI|nr:alpha/beta fold hydrolase [Salibacterium salarium]RSL32141.1 alpha/beta fold hydrolase [Salibacterium salarium]
MEENYPVMEGAEPFYFEGNETGVLVIHGFTGAPQSMRPLGETFHQAGFTVFGPRLAGHGTHYKDLEQTSYKEWCNTVEEGYHFLRETCSDIYIAGLSMGGTLTLHVAEQFPAVKGIILINAAIDVPNMNADTIVGTQYVDTETPDIKQEHVYELTYEKTPVQSFREIQKLMKDQREKLHDIQVPARIFVSDVDHVVPPSNSEYIYNGLASANKRIIPMHDSYHVATLDNDKEMIAIEAIAFINGLTTTSIQ